VKSTADLILLEPIDQHIEKGGVQRLFVSRHRAVRLMVASSTSRGFVRPARGHDSLMVSVWSCAVDNIYFSLTEAFNRHFRNVALASGQAVVFYRIALASHPPLWRLSRSR
jgi:hypothetical protein